MSIFRAHYHRNGAIYVSFISDLFGREEKFIQELLETLQYDCQSRRKKFRILRKFFSITFKWEIENYDAQPINFNIKTLNCK